MKKKYEIPLTKIASVEMARCTLSAESNKGTYDIGAKQRGNFYDDSSEDSFWSTDK